MENTDLVLFENPHFIIDMMYARENNMTGRPVYMEIGYGNKAYVHKNVAQKLLSLIPVLEEKQYKMRICDAYRPPIAHQKLLEIIPRAGFFAATPMRSNHCHGTAVDVCLTDINGNNLDYPTQIDAYEDKYRKQVADGNFDEFFVHLKKARHDYTEATDLQIENRDFLKKLMESHGFSSIEHEWWHYNISDFANYPMVQWENEL
ncbi:MAG: D-alanyl-D-alanine carboxypeptidase family protein [Alphaproteobacteria bacterium]|nr:D-alanyl-D-alanine carboxypeptidase family protein [Alphaproteobacteria bacterium]